VAEFFLCDHERFEKLNNYWIRLKPASHYYIGNDVKQRVNWLNKLNTTQLQKMKCFFIVRFVSIFRFKLEGVSSTRYLPNRGACDLTEDW
jgi:hypothetical protein